MLIVELQIRTESAPNVFSGMWLINQTKCAWKFMIYVEIGAKSRLYVQDVMVDILWRLTDNVKFHGELVRDISKKNIWSSN